MLKNNSKNSLNANVISTLLRYRCVLISVCLGMTKAACQPRLAYDCAHILSNHYPERLGAAFCVFPGHAFRTLWHTCRILLPPATASKVKVIQSRDKVRQCLETVCSPETVEWLVAEIRLNRSKKTIPERQKAFWKDNSATDEHDPRGTREYLDNWISNRHHKPHPNIIDAMGGTLLDIRKECKGDDFRETEGVEDDEEEEEDICADFDQMHYISNSSTATTTAADY